MQCLKCGGEMDALAIEYNIGCCSSCEMESKEFDKEYYYG